MPSFTLSAEDAYRILEIKVGATESDIKAAYKKLALKTHPDKNPNDAAASKKFLAVSEAYKRLTEEEFSDEDDYDDYDDEDEDFDISEIFAFRMFERMFFDAASNSQGKKNSNGNNGNNNNSRKNVQGGVQFSFPGMGNGGGCNCPDCRRRFGYEKAKPWREYVPKSQRTDIPKEEKKEIDPSIHDNWLSDDDDLPKPKTHTKSKSKKAQKRENAAKEQKAQIERLEREAEQCNLHHNNHCQNHDASVKESHMHINKVNKIKLKQEEEKLKLEQEKISKATKRKDKEPSNNQKARRQKEKSKSRERVENDSGDDRRDDEDDSDLDIEEMASRMGIIEGNNAKAASKSNKKNSSNAVKGQHKDVSAPEFTTSPAQENHKYKEQITMLQEMGFDYMSCLRAIEAAFGSVELAATMLLQNETPDAKPNALSSSSSEALSSSRNSSIKNANANPHHAANKRTESTSQAVPHKVTNAASSSKKPVTILSKQTKNPSVQPNSTNHVTKSSSSTTTNNNGNKNPAPTSYLNATNSGQAGHNNINKKNISEQKFGQQQTVPLPEGLFGQAKKHQSPPHPPKPSIFTPPDNQHALNNVMPAGLSLHDSGNGSINNQTFDFFNQQHKKSPESQSNPALSKQAMPMPVQQHQHKQQSSASSTSEPSSNFMAMFRPRENGSNEIGNSNVTDPLGLGTPSLSDLLLNNDSSTGNNGSTSPEMVTSIFDNADDLKMSGLGVDISGLGAGNTSTASLSSLLGGSEHGHSSGQHQVSDQDMLGSLLGDVSSLIGSSTSADISLDIGAPFLLDTEKLLNDSPFNTPVTNNNNQGSSFIAQPLSASQLNTQPMNTAAAVVKNGIIERSTSESSASSLTPGPPSKTRATSSSSITSSPGSPPASSGTSSTRCMYFFTSRGCRHGATCKFSHQANAPISSAESNYMGSKNHHQGRTNAANLTMSKKPCMFYSTPQGCKHGSLCRFVHSNKSK